MRKTKKSTVGRKFQGGSELPGPIDHDFNADVDNAINNLDNNNSNSGMSNFGMGISPLITRAADTINNFGVSAGWWGEDPLDVRLKELQKERDERLNNTQFSGSNATLNEQSLNLPYFSRATADDFGGTKDPLQEGIAGAAQGAAVGFGTGAWQAGLISGFADSLLRGESAKLRNYRLKSGLTHNDKVTADRTKRGIAGILLPFIGSHLNQPETTSVLDEYNKDINDYNRNVLKKFNYAIANTDANTDRFRIGNIYNTENTAAGNLAAFGGMLETNGATWPIGVTYIDNGGTHEANPYGGVQFGVASDGLPNLVEEGEVVIKVKDTPDNRHSFAEGGNPSYTDFVISNRRFPILEEIANAKITDVPEKYVGMPWSDIYKDILEKSKVKESINRQDSKDYIDSLNTRTARAHEITAMREDQEKILKALKKATPEQQDIILQQMGYGNPMEEAIMAAKGGKIYIKPSKRGTFTAAAKKRGMGVQEFASKVLANKEDYSPAMVKKANFARNFGGHKHADGGYLYQWGGWDNQEELTKFYQDEFRKAVKKSDYLTGAEARQWIANLEAGDEKQQALASMLKNQWGDANTDWSTNATWEFKNKYNPKGTVVESNPYLKWAGDNEKMKDGLWGIKHGPQLAVENTIRRAESPYIIPTYNYNSPFASIEGIADNGEAPTIIMDDVTPNDRIVAVEGQDGSTYVIPESEAQNIVYPDSGDYTLAETDTDIYPTPIIKHKPITRNNSIIESDSTKDAYTPDWIIPALSGANLLSDILGVTNVADYSNADRIGRAILGPKMVASNPTGRYIKPVYTDTNYLANSLANQGAGAISAVKNLSGANRNTAMANIANLNYNTQKAIGDTILKGDAENFSLLMDAIKANNEVDEKNRERALQADMANQSNWEHYANRYAAQKTAEARLRESIDEEVAANRSANWNNFLENLQSYFEHNRNLNMANSAFASTGYSENRRGDIRYGKKNKKQ